MLYYSFWIFFRIARKSIRNTWEILNKTFYIIVQFATLGEHIKRFNHTRIVLWINSIHSITLSHIVIWAETSQIAKASEFLKGGGMQLRQATKGGYNRIFYRIFNIFLSSICSHSDLYINASIQKQSMRKNKKKNIYNYKRSRLTHFYLD